MANKLFNRFIDLEFTVDDTNTESGNRKVSFKCPTWGIKPNIALSMTLLPTGNTSNVTIKVMNMYSEINIAKYRFVRIRAGYKDSLYSEFFAEIKNSYVERPNPEGITIFNCVYGTVSSMYNTKEPIVIKFTANITVPDMFKLVADSFGLTLQASIPEEWKSVVFTTREYTQTYRNALEMWSDIKTKVRILSEAHAIPHIYTSVTGNTMYVLSMLAGSDSEKSLVLDKVSTAYVTGGAIVVKAPWLPTLQPTGLFKMDTRFFRGRMGTLDVGGEKKIFRAYSMNVGFSTYGENYMEVNATDLSIAGDWQ